MSTIRPLILAATNESLQSMDRQMVAMRAMQGGGP